MSDDEQEKVWEKAESIFKFESQIGKVFLANIDFDVYAIPDYRIWQGSDKMNRLIRKCFISCMDEASYIYALDWNHACFRFNPRITYAPEQPVFAADSRYSGGGYNIYFPEFYPNGDYYFYISTDFSWGYLSHPWQKSVFIFGDKLKKQIDIRSKQLGFKRIE
ncbi:MAG: DUF2716 domain-containing protein [Oscillospiraceae bacterium]|nr:DUF2716 domain-containing protein [Oscillospiraceae bacterium]